MIDLKGIGIVLWVRMVFLLLATVAAIALFIVMIVWGFRLLF